jgi:hypothetical protein
VTWAYAGLLESDLAEVSVIWNSGESETCTTPTKGCMFKIAGEQAGPPQLIATSFNGISTAGVAPTRLPIRTFEPTLGAVLDQEYKYPRPQSKCMVENGLKENSYTASNDFVANAAYQEQGSSTVHYLYLNGTTGVAGSVPLTVQGSAVNLFRLNDWLSIAADDLEIWDFDGRRSGDPESPVLVETVPVFGADPISVATFGRDHFTSARYLLAAQNPPRYALIDARSVPAIVEVDDVVLPGVDGQILDLAGTFVGHRGADYLFVLTDAGASGRLYNFNLGDRLAPVAINQVDLAGTAAGSEIEVKQICDGSYCRYHLLVVRRGWGIEVYDADLSLRVAIELPGDPSDVRLTVPDGVTVTLGNLGVVSIHDIFGTPVVSFASSNADSPGYALRFNPHKIQGVLTPNGISRSHTYYPDLAKSEGEIAPRFSGNEAPYEPPGRGLQPIKAPNRK